jgi:hypothetical protein
MKSGATTKKTLKDIPLDIKAEMALKEAVADAIAKHKKLGYPISVWRNGKVVSIPAHEIVIPPQDTKGTYINENLLSIPVKNQSTRTIAKEGQIKEKARPYRKTRKKRNNSIKNTDICMQWNALLLRSLSWR